MYISQSANVKAMLIYKSPNNGNSYNAATCIHMSDIEITTQNQTYTLYMHGRGEGRSYVGISEVSLE